MNTAEVGDRCIQARAWQPTRPAKGPTRECVGRLAGHGSPLIDRSAVRRSASLRISALAVPSLQQVGRSLPHLHEPENQGEYDDDAAELTDPRTPFPGRVLVHGTSSWALSVRRGRVLHTIIMNDPGMRGGRRLGFAAVESA